MRRESIFILTARVTYTRNCAGSSDVYVVAQRALHAVQSQRLERRQRHQLHDVRQGALRRREGPPRRGQTVPPMQRAAGTLEAHGWWCVDAARLCREANDKTTRTQNDVGRRLGDRIGDIEYWKTEILGETDQMITEIDALNRAKAALEKMLADLETPLHIAQECLYNREKRQGIDLVHDDVERALLKVGPHRLDRDECSKFSLNTVMNMRFDKSHLTQTDPRDAVRHAHPTVHKARRSV